MVVNNEHADEGDLQFVWILAEVLAKPEPVEFVMAGGGWSPPTSAEVPFQPWAKAVYAYRRENQLESRTIERHLDEPSSSYDRLRRIGVQQVRLCSPGSLVVRPSPSSRPA